MRAKPVRPIAGTMGVLTIRQFSLSGLTFLEGLVGGAHTVCCPQRLQLFEESKLIRSSRLFGQRTADAIPRVLVPPCCTNVDTSLWKGGWYATRLIRLVATDISQDLLLKWWEPTTGKAWRTPRSSALLSV